MKYLSWILPTFFIVLVWLMVLPFAISALPYLWLTHKLEIDSKGYETVLDFFISLKGMPNW